MHYLIKTLSNIILFCHRTSQSPCGVCNVIVGTIIIIITRACQLEYHNSLLT